MLLPESAYIQFTPDLRICRLLNGMWQVSGGHGAIDAKAAVQSMFDYHDAGFTTWDLADHYGPAEDFIGAFRRAMAAQRGRARAPVQLEFCREHGLCLPAQCRSRRPHFRHGRAAWHLHATSCRVACGG